MSGYQGSLSIRPVGSFLGERERGGIREKILKILKPMLYISIYKLCVFIDFVLCCLEWMGCYGCFARLEGFILSHRICSWQVAEKRCSFMSAGVIVLSLSVAVLYWLMVVKQSATHGCILPVRCVISNKVAILTQLSTHICPQVQSVHLLFVHSFPITQL